jgi:hypothetical protein
MQSKEEFAYHKLVSFYTGLVSLTGLATLLMAFFPQMPACSQFTSSNATAPIAYLCSPEGVNYILQVMVYALGLSLGCLLLVVLMRNAEQRHSH